MTLKKSILLSLSSLIIGVIGCNQADRSPPDSSTQKVQSPVSQEWLNLFDGTTLDGWRGFNRQELPDNWIIEDAMLKCLGNGGDIGGDLVYGAEVFEYFELELEWKISPGGNSGIFYHVLEGEQYQAPYETGPEYQLIDNLNFPQPLEDWQMTAADYAMYPANTTREIIKPALEWNRTKIHVTPDKTEHWLNGQKVVEFIAYSDDWWKRRNSGKWNEYPDYAKSKTGLIGLQDHGSFIWFKNIRIRPL